MDKTFNPKLEILEFNVSDIVTTSIDLDNSDNYTRVEIN